MAVTVHVLTARNRNEIDNGFADIARRQVDGLLVMSDPIVISERARLVALAARHSIQPSIKLVNCRWPEELMSYGSNISGLYHQLGTLSRDGITETRWLSLA